MGFTSGPLVNQEELDQKIYRAASEEARRKFSPEFMNRIDKVIVFRTLQPTHLEQILEIELGMVQQRIFNAAGVNSFVLSLSNCAKDHLLREGTDLKYGARHLKRAIERHVVYPLASLLATGQIGLGDVVMIDFDGVNRRLLFHREAGGALVRHLARACALEP
jgi:ATP-dependent Clp protease ATP-binding subunit ClpB